MGRMLKRVLLAGIACATASTAHASSTAESAFGQLADGTPVEAITLRNDHGMAVRVITYGAALQSVIVPDRDGKPADVVVAYDSFAPYLVKSQYFGATVGRVANRVAKGRFAFNGHDYQLPVNNGPNTLHGGTKGFDKVLWEVVSVKSGSAASVTMRYVSPDGDQGFPGMLTTYATYSLDERDQLTIEYRATTDASTVVNISNHTYWNLAGAGSPRGAMGQMLTIPADRYTPTDATSIPLGPQAPVAGTPFDFRTPHTIGDRVRDGSSEQIRFAHGYDHNWVIGDHVTPGTHLMARVADPVSGRSFELWSNQPGLQFYSGNFLDGTTVGKGGKMLRMGDAIVLEPQDFPDAVNHNDYPSERLDPGQTYRNVIIYKFRAGVRKR